jgi:CHAT domain-containing protein
LLSLLFLATYAPVAASTEPRTIAPGETVQARMPAGDPDEASVEFEFVAASNGPTTIETFTLEFDTHVEAVLLGEGGVEERVAEDDDGGVGWNSRIVLETTRGQRYRLTVRPREDWGGPFELSVSERAPDDPGPEIEREREWIYWESVEREAERTDRPLLAARSHLGRGSLYSTERAHEKAVHELEAAHTLFNDLLGASHPRTRGTRGRWLSALAKAGDEDRAIAILRGDVEAAEERGDPEEIAEKLLALGRFLKVDVSDRGLEAQVPLRRALQLLESIHGPDSLELVRPLDRLTWWYQYQLAKCLPSPECVAEQEQMLKRWVSLVETHLGADAPQLGVPLGRLGQLREFRNSKDPAVDRYYERALRVLDGAAREYETDLATVLYAYGHHLANTSRYERAEILLTRAMDILDIDSSNSLAFLYFRMRRYPEAKAMMQRLLAEQEQARGQDDPLLMGILNQLKMVTCRLEELEECQQYIERMIRIHERSFGPDLRLTHRYVELSQVLRRRGQSQEARRLMDEAVDDLKACLSKVETPSAYSAYYLRKLAKALHEEGRYAEAYEVYLELVGAELSGARVACRGLPEERALDYAAKHGPEKTTDLVLTMLAERFHENPESVTRAWDGVIRGRALVLDEMSMRQRLAFRAGDDAVRRLITEVSAAREQLAYLTVAQPSESSHPDAYEAALVTARTNKEKAEARLAERSDDFMTLMTASEAGFAEVARSTPSDAALVAYVQYEVTHRSSAGPLQRRGESFLVFGLAPGRKRPFVVSLGSAWEIEQLVSVWLQCTRVPEDRLPVSSTQCVATGRALRSRVWDPVSTRLGDVKRVLIVSDGDLQRISFAALPEEDDRFVAEAGPLLHYLSSERDLVMPPATARSRGLLALGGPAFGRRAGPGTSGGSPATVEPFRGRRSTCGDFRTLRFEPLPGTEQEVAIISRLWKESRQDEGVTLLTGASAAETTLKALAPGHRYLHLATHGFFLGRECSVTAGLERGIGGLAAAEPATESRPVPVRTATDPTARAMELEHAGRWSKALELYEQAVEFRKRTLGPNDPSVAEALSRWGLLLWKDHDDWGVEVEPLLEQADAIDPASFSGGAGVLLKVFRREFAEAESEARELVARVEAEHGAESIEMANALELLAETIWENGGGKDPDVRKWTERALEIRRAVHGEEHPDVARGVHNVGLIHHELGETEEAYRHYKMALDILERIPDTYLGLAANAYFMIGFDAPTREEKIAALAKSINLSWRWPGSGPWYSIDALKYLEPLVSDPEILRELLDPGILPPDESPLLRSGLALAGADQRDQAGPGEDDGILTAEEIAALDLSGVEWAVLSACDTGVGEVRAGEGVFGLRRAFQIAGARTLIMSLWSVDDESTREWMTALYEARLRDGLSTAESVRQASLGVLEARRKAGESAHPFYWAAFVAAGDWR